MQFVKLSTKQMEDLAQRLRALPDARKARGKRHRQPTVLTIAMAAVLAGTRGYTAIAEWAGRLTQPQLKRLRARYNPRTRRFEAPSEPTIRRTLRNADIEALDHTLGQWLLGLAPCDAAIAVDGKTVRGAVGADGAQPHLLSALFHDSGVTVASREVGPKTNEIPEIQPLLKPLDITGHVVTADAMHTQRETARFLVEDKQAHYLFTVKDNQPTLREAIAELSPAHFSPLRRNP